jgi:hypothetical protein
MERNAQMTQIQKSLPALSLNRMVSKGRYGVFRRNIEKLKEKKTAIYFLSQGGSVLLYNGGSVLLYN